MLTVGSQSNVLAILMLGVVSFAVAIGWTLDLHNADSLIPTLVSLDYWLPFYWGQDRFGMLLPLVTMPVRDSFWNLVAQNALGVFLLLAGAYAAAVRCTVRRPAIVPLGLLSLVLAWPAETTALHLLTTNQSYSPALGLYAIAFGLLRRDSSWTTRMGTASLMALGAWTNAGTGLLVLAVFTVAAAMPHLRPDALWLSGGAIFSLAGHLALQKLAPGVRLDTSHVTLANLGQVTSLAAGFWSDAYQRFLGPAVWLTIPAIALACALERRSAAAIQAVIAVIVGCVAYGFVMIVFFGSTGRHISPVLPLLCGAILVVFARHLPATRADFAIAALAMAVMIQARADWPEAGRRRLISRFGQGHAVELYREGVTIVTGDYWQAWPYAFALNLLHEGVSGSRPVLPVALRSEDFYLQRAQHVAPGTKLAVVPPGDYRYWSVRGPRAELSIVRIADDYEVAVVNSVEE